MTIQEAINVIDKYTIPDIVIGKTVIEAHSMAKAALEKQIPESPDYEGDGYGDNRELIYDTAYCPSCRHVFEVDYDKSDYCPECGQRLDWREDYNND